jgi:hypothetical protein
MTKTLADLLREDGAAEGDIYEACGNQWRVSAYNGWLERDIDGDLVQFSDYKYSMLPADGWKRVSPKKPLRVEFEQTVVELPSYQPAIYSDALADLVGKRVRVTVEALEGPAGEGVGE